MAVFEYKAQTREGNIVEGRIDNGSRQDALRRLADQGLRPLRLNVAAAPGAGGGAKEKNGAAAEAGAGAAKRWEWPSFRRRGGVSHEALQNFTRQLATLLGAGVSLSRALSILARQAKAPAAAARWRDVHDRVVDGASLANAMAQNSEVFPRVYIAMVRAGETGGFLDLVLGQIAEFQTREKENRARVTSALTYPAVLMTLTVGVMVFLLTFFIPRFQAIFEGFGASLPALTRAIIATSEFLMDYGLFVAMAAGLAAYALRQWLASEAGRRRWHQAELRLPVIGPLVAKTAMARFCRMLGTLSGAGVSLITALRVARESLDNQTLLDAIREAIERVQKGEPLAKSLGDCPALFPPAAVEMIAVAEESSRLDKELVRLAEVTDKELDSQVRMAVALVEPLLLFVMAALIGVIFVGMVIPIFTIQEYIK